MCTLALDGESAVARTLPVAATLPVRSELLTVVKLTLDVAKAC
jgi:hypothetical protein